MPEDKPRHNSEKTSPPVSHGKQAKQSFELDLNEPPAQEAVEAVLDELEFEPPSTRYSFTESEAPVERIKSVPSYQAPSPAEKEVSPRDSVDMIPDLNLGAEPVTQQKDVRQQNSLSADSRSESAETPAGISFELMNSASGTTSQAQSGSLPLIDESPESLSPASSAPAEPLDLDAALGGFEMGFDQGSFAGMESMSGQSGAEVELASAQLEKELRWPQLVPVEIDEQQLDDELILQQSGYGLVPTKFWLTPLYSLTVFLSNRGLPQRVKAAQTVVDELERRQENSLGELAEIHRENLAEQPRFSQLYAEQAKNEQQLSAQLAEVEILDRASAELMAALELRVNNARGHLSVQQQKSSSAALELATLNEQVSRVEAQRSRLAIERRNRMGSLAEFAELPVELAKQYNDKERHFIQVVGQARQKIGKKSRDYEHFLDASRVAMAELQTLLAEKAALHFAHTGDLSIKLEELERARDSYRTAAAATGRALVHLRGEIEVKDEVREELLSLEAQLYEAQEKLALVKNAPKACDATAYQQGIYLGGGFLGAFLLSLIWAVFR